MFGNDIYQLCDNLNAELIKVSEWFRSNKLSLNAKKSNFICFGNKPLPITTRLPMLCLDGHSIECIDHCKFLGIFVDSKLNWKKHIDQVSLKIAK